MPPNSHQNIVQRQKNNKKSRSLQQLQVNNKHQSKHYESNMMISCISSILYKYEEHNLTLNEFTINNLFSTMIKISMDNNWRINT